MILSHFTAKKPIKFDANRIYPICRENFKPVGLWLSDESEHGWSAWCRAEEWGLPGLEHNQQFECDTSRWRVIKSSAELLKFHASYSFKGKTALFEQIDWKRVKEDYSGILITPYRWEQRNELMWYYGWDCASACVWDLSTVRPVPQVCPENRPCQDCRDEIEAAKDREFDERVALGYV